MFPHLPNRIQDQQLDCLRRQQLPKRPKRAFEIPQRPVAASDWRVEQRVPERGHYIWRLLQRVRLAFPKCRLSR